MSAAPALALLAAVASLARTAPAAGRLAPRPEAVRPVAVPWGATRPLAAGIEAWVEGRREKALTLFLKAVEESPQDPIAWHDLGVAYLSASRFDDALLAFRHERFLTPLAASAWYGMGKCFLAQGHPDLAENAFVLAVTDAPREWAMWQGLAEAFRAQGKAQQADVASRNVGRLRPHAARRRWGPFALEQAVLNLRFPRLPTAR